MRGKASLVAASLVMAGLAFSPLESAWSEPKPTSAPTVTNEVQVGKPGGSPAASPGAKPGAPAAPEAGSPPTRRILKRNPFVPPDVGGQSVVVQPVPGGNPTGPRTPRPVPTKTKPPEPPPQAPPFSVAGLFSSGGFPTALLITPKGPIEARVGTKVGGYTVTSINLSTRQVVLAIKSHAFRLSLPQEGPHGWVGGSTPGAGAAPGGAPAAAPGGQPMPQGGPGQGVPQPGAPGGPGGPGGQVKPGGNGPLPPPPPAGGGGGAPPKKGGG